MKLPKTYTKDKKHVHVVIETPYKSRNKFELNEYDHLQHIKDLNQSKLNSIVYFFENYNKRDREFKLLEIVDAYKAHHIIKKHKTSS